MKKLIILRGTPGSGKSTWVKENHLEDYTLCPDTLRLMFSAPVKYNGEYRIAREPELEKIVWKTLMYMLETRMQRGDLTVVDAMCRKVHDIKGYAELCNKYDYDLIVVDFSSIPLNVCIRQNSTRNPIRYVPEEAITKVWNGMQCQDIYNIQFKLEPKSYKVIKYNENIGELL